MVVKVAVLGAGINGLACAVKIKEKFNNAQVVLISSEFSPNTTGDGSAGLWFPYLCGDTPGELLAKWGCESYDFLHQLWLEGGRGICLMPIYSLYGDRSHYTEPHWRHHVFGYHRLSDSELNYYSRRFAGTFVAGHTFSTFAFSPPPFLSYLLARFKLAGGKVLQAAVSSLRDPALEGFDVVVNCTGLAARNLVPDDGVFSYRGQVIRVKAPWVAEIMMDEDSGMYIIPNADTVVLGGTKQKNDYNTKVDDNDTATILSSCKQIMPSLQSVEIYSQWVGLRPGRHSVRLDSEQRDGQLIIHNYGHGGCGLTLFWGCASDVLQLLEQHVNRNIKQHSKL